MHHFLLAAPLSVRGVMLDCLVGAGMIVIGLSIILLNRLLKKAEADQIAHLWLDGNRVFGDEEPESGADSRTRLDQGQRPALSHREG